MSRDLKFEAEYRNPPAEVWRALTDSHALGAWLMENDFLPRPGHHFHFRFRSRLGGERRIPCEVLVVEEPRLLSFRWGEGEAWSRSGWRPRAEGRA